MSDQIPQFSPGDRVMHALRPEWGAGDVRSAEVMAHQGKAGQRLTIRFTNHGQVTVHTATARIVPAEQAAQPAPAMAATAEPGGWLGALEGGNTTDALTEIPEAASDPFRSTGARLQTTLDLYRFDESARLLIDWAVAQTGMRDPLTEFSREQLEQAFQVFSQRREVHLLELVRTIRRAGESQTLDTAAQHRDPAARDALKRAQRRA